MSVYTDLLAAGFPGDTAREIADAVQRTAGIVTVTVLDTRLAKLEASLTRLLLTTMVAMTGIFALFVGGMTWVVTQALAQ